LPNIYRNKYSFDGGFSTYPYLKNVNCVLHVSPEMWEISDKNKKNIILKSLKSIDNVCLLFSKLKNSNFIELYERGYEDAKNNKGILDYFLDLTQNSRNGMLLVSCIRCFILFLPLGNIFYVFNKL
jgi:hypothetical protein